MLGRDVCISSQNTAYQIYCRDTGNIAFTDCSGFVAYGKMDANDIIASKNMKKKSY